MRCFILSRLIYAVVKVLLKIAEILSNFREPSLLSTKSKSSFSSRNDRKLGSFQKTNPNHIQQIQSLYRGDILWLISGGKRTRTADILLAKQALYQLSYTPNIEIWAILDLNQGPHPYQGCALTT